MKTVRIIFISIIFLTFANFAQIKVSFDVVTHQNERPYQEDRFAYADIKNGQFFGIYDGHGGDKTSSYLQSTLHKNFVECLSGSFSIKRAFECAYTKAESYALDHYDDGSTAATVYIDTNGRVHFAWVGDSRAVLEGNGNVVFSTLDHKPDRKEEQKRIEKSGGTIELFGVWRVNGLAVSRSIGDKELKKVGKGQIIATPEYAKVQLSADNHFMIIASDGLWDVISSDDAVNIIKEALKNGMAIKNIVLLLQNKAIELGSGDNITVGVVLLKYDSAQKSPSLFGQFWNWLWRS